MAQDGLDRYQLAGLDDRERGFTRPVELERAGEHYRAILRYEAIRVSTDPQPTQENALLRLIDSLQAKGYRQLRTQVSFRNGIYLGSQEMWIEYPDPPQPEPGSACFVSRLMSWFRSRAMTG